MPRPVPLQALQRHPRATLALAALAMVGGYAWLIPWHARHGDPVPDWTLALDLLVVLPLLAWWLQPAPRGRGALFAALAVAPDLMERSGSIQWVEDVSEEFDIRDERGQLAPRYHSRQR